MIVIDGRKAIADKTELAPNAKVAVLNNLASTEWPASYVRRIMCVAPNQVEILQKRWKVNCR
jgi:hypothetical protein